MGNAPATFSARDGSPTPAANNAMPSGRSQTSCVNSMSDGLGVI
jgi:hypothetical protein